MKLSRSQKWKLHRLNKERIARGLNVISAEAAYLALGENEQKLTSDRQELFPYDIYNNNYRNNGDIVNIQNPSFQQIEKGGYVGDARKQLRKESMDLFIVPFILNNGDMINILPRNPNRKYLAIRSDTTNVNNVTLTSLLYILMRGADDSANFTIQKDAIILSAGNEKEFNQIVPVNAISLHYPKLFDATPSAINTITGSILWG